MADTSLHPVLPVPVVQTVEKALRDVTATCRAPLVVPSCNFALTCRDCNLSLVCCLNFFLCKIFEKITRDYFGSLDLRIKKEMKEQDVRPAVVK